MQPFRALLVAEDATIIPSALRAMLAWWGFSTVIAGNGAEAWQILASADAPRFVIVDWVTPGMDAVEFCRRLRASESGESIYLMLLIARQNSADLAAAISAGADDFLRKPFDAHELRARVRAGRRIVELREEICLARQELQKAETRDPLTSLCNRPSIVSALERLLAAGGNPAILLADLDRFRLINDMFGAAAGDSALADFARRLEAAAPPPAMVGRYAGDEFLVLLPGSDEVHANDCADRIRAATAGKPFTFGAAAFPATSMVIIVHSRHSNATALLREAEETLASAKRESRERLAETLRSRSADLRHHGMSGRRSRAK